MYAAKQHTNVGRAVRSTARPTQRKLRRRALVQMKNHVRTAALAKVKKESRIEKAADPCGIRTNCAKNKRPPPEGAPAILLRKMPWSPPRRRSPRARGAFRLRRNAPSARHAAQTLRFALRNEARPQVQMKNHVRTAALAKVKKESRIEKAADPCGIRTNCAKNKRPPPEGAPAILLRKMPWSPPRRRSPRARGAFRLRRNAPSARHAAQTLRFASRNEARPRPCEKTDARISRTSVLFMVIQILPSISIYTY